MGHCVQAIVAPLATANLISRRWPELPRFDCKNGVVIFPVDEDLIDTRIAPDSTPTESGNEFMLLTNGFRKLLQGFSQGGVLAYVETEYFGGAGGQGALVCRDGVEIMPPKWKPRRVINEALALLGVTAGLLADRFTVTGFADVRSNDDLLDLIATQSANRQT